MINVSISSELSGNMFKVNLLNSKTLNILFSHTFKVYAGFDKKGLIEDTLFMYKRNLKK